MQARHSIGPSRCLIDFSRRPQWGHGGAHAGACAVNGEQFDLAQDGGHRRMRRGAGEQLRLLGPYPGQTTTLPSSGRCSDHSLRDGRRALISPARARSLLTPSARRPLPRGASRSFCGVFGYRGRGRPGGVVAMRVKNSSMRCTAFMNPSRSTGLVT